MDALQILADGKRRTTQELADELGLHRSIVYRILRTFEDYTLVARGSDGRYLLGLGMAALAESGMGDLEAHIVTILQELSNLTSATAIFCGPQRNDVVVLSSARPSQRTASVAIRTGTRVPLSAGAPGLAILSLLEQAEPSGDSAATPPRHRVIRTTGEPFIGLDALSVPIRILDGQAASLSLVFPIGDVDINLAENELCSYSLRLTKPADVWEN